MTKNKHLTNADRLQIEVLPNSAGLSKESQRNLAKVPPPSPVRFENAHAKVTSLRCPHNRCIKRRECQRIQCEDKPRSGGAPFAAVATNSAPRLRKRSAQRRKP